MEQCLSAGKFCEDSKANSDAELKMGGIDPKNVLEDLLDFAKSRVPFHAKRAPAHHRVLGEWPLMTKQDLVDYSIDKSQDLLSMPHEPGGYLLLSGGTTGDPKCLFYSHSEADDACRKIAQNFKANGLERGDRVVNYFPAGYMYSSFLMVDRALSALPVTILPLGFTRDMDFVADVLDRFRPNAIAGITSAILDLVRCRGETGRHLRIDKVFYGGEPLSPSGETLIRRCWESRLIRSAGYASTDFGPIGWQCLHCETGEHHVFGDVHMEIIDGEIVATSLSRRAMPLVRYRTGDGGEWIAGRCRCGDTASRFRLLHRTDNVILIWGCRLLYDDLVSALKACDASLASVQAYVRSTGTKDRLLVRFESPIDGSIFPLLRDSIYRQCFDLKKSVPRAMLDEHVAFEVKPEGSLLRNPRTGKVIPIIDAR